MWNILIYRILNEFARTFSSFIFPFVELSELYSFLYFFIPSSLPSSLPPYLPSSFSISLLRFLPPFLPPSLFEGNSKWVIICHWLSTMTQLNVEIWDSSSLFPHLFLFAGSFLLLVCIITFLCSPSFNNKHGQFFFTHPSIINAWNLLIHVFIS